MREQSCRPTMALTLAFLFAASQLAAQEHAPATANDRPRVVLVELFTSEGCSSCPPADALLKQVNGTQTAAGQLIVGISEHVTYWNSLGWADPFSSPVYTDRQNAYGSSFGLDSVYTPQMVVNGHEQFNGSDKRELERALRAEREQPQPVVLRILETNVMGSSLTVKFSAVEDSSVRNADVVAVLADDMDQSSVLRGENSGRNLTHVAVARSITRVGKFQSGADQTVQVPIPAALTSGKTGHHLILFAQAHGNGRVLGADTTALPSASMRSHNGN